MEHQLRPPTEQFFLNASLGANQWWRWVLGVVAIAVIWIGIGSIGLVYAGYAFLEATNLGGLTISDGEITGDGSLIAKLVLFGLGFAIGLAGIWLVLKLVHKKDLQRVVTGRASFDVSRYLFAMLVAFVISLALFLTNRFILQVDGTFRAPDAEFAYFLMVAIILVPIQSGFEEVLFRGYILQGTMLLLKNKAVLALLSGVLFSLPHLSNPEAAEFGFLPYVSALVASGAFHALIVLLDGGIELAAGYHAMNNLFMGVVANAEGAVITTPSLFLIQKDSYELFPNLALDILFFALAVVLLNFRYKWFRLGAR